MPLRWTFSLTSLLLLASCAIASPTSAICDSEALTRLLESGNQAYESGDLAKAESSWETITQCPGSNPDWPKAMFNLGLLKLRLADYSGAIANFEAVLNSHPNDREPGDSVMQTNRNYSYRSSLEISACYEQMGNYREALRYARLAKTRYRYYSWCGTCYQSAASALNRRIAYLTFQVSKYYVLSIALLGGFVFIRYKTNKH